MTATTEHDNAFMRRAIELAEQYRGRTSPNPIVGCVIVDSHDSILAEGAHRTAGAAHAEVDALAKLGGNARDATMYVTLEPCTHHGRTPPCAPAVVASGVSRVVVGSEDPVAGHGGGMALLRQAGIIVDRALVAECDASNRPFLTWAKHGRPAFTLKAAISLDGKIATVRGESQWITGEAARADVHRMRDSHDAVLVGVGTVLADDPLLTARVPGGRDPVRIVVDTGLRIPATAKLVTSKGPRTIVATTDIAERAAEDVLVAAGVEVWRFAPANGQVPLEQLAKQLGAEGITSVLVEGGGQVHASFLQSELADELVIYIAPKLLGGPAPSWVGGAGVASLAAAHGFRFEGDVVRLGDDLRIRAVRRT